jgi:hypothetical protein
VAGIGKQLVPFFHGMDHGIAAHTISAAFQYHVVRVERFMVSVIAHIPRRFVAPAVRTLSLGARNQVVRHAASADFGDAIMCVQQESRNLQPFPIRSSADKE